MTREVPDIVQLAVRIFHLRGFSGQDQQLRFLPNLCGFQLLLATLDLFFDQHQLIQQVVQKDKFFTGSNLNALLSSFLLLKTDSSIAREQIKKSLLALIKRMNELTLQLSTSSAFLSAQFSELLSSYDNPSRNLELTFTYNLRWTQLRSKIQSSQKLTKKNEEEWRETAFLELNKESLFMLIDKYIIKEKSIISALSCLKLL